MAPTAILVLQLHRSRPKRLAIAAPGQPLRRLGEKLCVALVPEAVHHLGVVAMEVRLEVDEVEAAGVLRTMRQPALDKWGADIAGAHYGRQRGRDRRRLLRKRLAVERSARHDRDPPLEVLSGSL